MAKGKRGKAPKKGRKKAGPKKQPEATAPSACGHEHVEAQPSDGSDWRSAFADVVDFLRYLDDIVRAVQRPDLDADEFLGLLRDLDELGITWESMDKEAVRGLGPEGRRELFRHFITDVFMKKMNFQRELDQLQAYELLKVQCMDGKGPLPRFEHPVFHRMLLGLVQTVIGAHLNTGRGGGTEGDDDMMPEPALLDSLWADEETPVLGFTEDDMAEGFWALISPFDMLKITSTAVMAYLTWRDPKMPEDTMVEALASLTPPVFILLACSEVLHDMTRALIAGGPMLRKVKDDGSCSRGAGFHFVLSEEGQARLT